jgi:nucleoside-diphosphate-sugar epimerase
VGQLAGLAGRKPPRTVPTALLKALAPAGRLVGPALGFPPNLRELIRSSDGVTFWARSDKAREELGWNSRPLREGLQELVDARRG